MKSFIRVMKALSDPSRVTIVKMLEGKGLCVCEITSVLGLAQSTVSKHLKILEDAGLVESWRDGGWVNYRLAESSENPYAQVMGGHLKNWLAESPQVQEVLGRAATVDRLRISAA